MKSLNIWYVQDTCIFFLIAGNNVIYLLHKAVARAAFFFDPQFRTVMVALLCTFIVLYVYIFSITFIHVSLLYSGYWISFPKVKWLGIGIEHPLFCSTEVTELSCTSTTNPVPS